jgi:hypothetical protein
METATATALVPATLVTFIERRRAGSVPPRGMVFVERRRPRPVLVVEADDLHAADADRVLADALDFGFGSDVAAPFVASQLARSVDADALDAHVLRASALELLA